MSQLNPPPFKDPVDQGSRGGLMSTWHAWFSQLFKWLQSLGDSVSNLVSNNTGINTGDQTNITGTAANLSGTPALPNGTTATTQANGDSSTKLANDAFVQAALTYYNTAVVWDGVNDRVLGVGQITQDSFTSATSMPLHIACGDGQVYEIQFNGVAAAAASGITILQPNNAVPTTNLFTIGQLFGSSTGSGANYSTGSADSGFRLNAAGSLLVATIVVSVQTVNKNTKSTYISAVGGTVIDYFGDEFSLWQDTTTVWASLGTITMPNAWTGTITVRRVA